MTTAQVVETTVTVNNNSPIQDYVHPDDQQQQSFYSHILNLDTVTLQISKETLLEAGEKNNEDLSRTYNNTEADNEDLSRTYNNTEADTVKFRK